MGLQVESVLEFLYKNQYYQSFIALEQEANQYLNNYPSELQCIYSLLTQGKFSLINSIINNLKGEYSQVHKQIYTCIATQELLENIDKCSLEIEDIVKSIKELSVYAEKEQIEGIVKAVGMKKLSEFQNWQVWKGRIHCWERVYRVLDEFLQGNDRKCLGKGNIKGFCIGKKDDLDKIQDSGESNEESEEESEEESDEESEEENEEDEESGEDEESEEEEEEIEEEEKSEYENYGDSSKKTEEDDEVLYDSIS